MNYNQFCGAATLEEYEVMRLHEPTILDTEMIERGDGPLFVSIYNSKYLKGRKSKPVTVKTDAEIVDEIFKSKLKPREQKFKKSVLPLVIKNKHQNAALSVHRSSQDLPKTSEVMFIMSLFK